MPIRPAAAQDAPAIAEIYNHYVRETVITFACRDIDAAHFAAQIAEGKYPFLVAESGEAVVGFAYASEFRQKDAFRWDTELTIYLAPGMERQGAGSRLMGALLRILKRQGYLTAYSCVTLPNEGSLRLHRRFGFTKLGIFPKTGYKLGRWCDVIWLQLPLGRHDSEPAEPRPFASLSADDIQALLAE